MTTSIPPPSLRVDGRDGLVRTPVSNKDGNVEQIKHMSKVLGEKLSETTQQFDNIVKILSSTIDKITDADMSFVNGR